MYSVYVDQRFASCGCDPKCRYRGEDAQGQVDHWSSLLWCWWFTTLPTRLANGHCNLLRYRVLPVLGPRCTRWRKDRTVGSGGVKITYLERLVFAQIDSESIALDMVSTYWEEDRHITQLGFPMQAQIATVDSDLRNSSDRRIPVVAALDGH